MLLAVVKPSRYSDTLWRLKTQTGVALQKKKQDQKMFNSN